MAASTDTFTNDLIAHYHSAALKRYMHLRVIGKTSIAALTGSFGVDYTMAMNPWAYINLIETSDAYLSGLAAAVAAMSDEQLWSAETSARVLYSIATDETAKRGERIQAAKELNVLFGITIIDEKGNTRAGAMSVEDLFRLKAQGATSSTAKH
ncbi:hypothetical protein [Paraburkholderia aspalathi]|uniref:hypothetical protein n=1 Tax=Paraburkholderia aspalathi TaxID=1324617 RepID=UPI003CB1C0C5